MYLPDHFHARLSSFRRIGSQVICTLALALALPICGTSHAASPPDLHQYEGLYEFGEGQTVGVAVSPLDGSLHAVLAGARYPLKGSSEPDVFFNAANERVFFIRGRAGRILGYRLADDDSARIFKQISSAPPLPKRAWYPRLAANRYAYLPPEAMDDGLPVAALGTAASQRGDIERLVNRILDRVYTDVHAVLVAKDGRLLVEEYFYEYDRDTLHPMRSATKTVVSTLVGIALDQGLLAGTDAQVMPMFTDDYPDIAHMSALKQHITLADLLSQRSGLDCDDWKQDSPGNETRMGRSLDWVKFVLDLPMADAPGNTARYCSGNVILLGRIVEKASGMSLPDFAEKYLFGPLGIHAYDWRFAPDPSSAETFTQLSLRPRDMLKFGLLFGADGMWNGRRIVSASWVRTATAHHTRLGDTDYGYLWWRPYLQVGQVRHDAIAAQGNGGQEIYLWPELGLTVVLTGGNYNRKSPSNTIFVKDLLPAWASIKKQPAP